MRILVVCQYYSPEPFKVADVCEALVSKGHEVDVITSFPNYPMGKIYDGYKKGAHRDEVINGVNVHRVFTVGRRTGFIWRTVNYYVYSVASTLYASKLKKDYDVVFVYQLSPVMMANAGIKYKKKHNKKLLLYCLDLWPDSLTSGGVKQGSLIFRYFEKVSERIYKSCDKILVSSKSFAEHLRASFSIEEEITYLPQYAENLFKPTQARQKETVDLTFAGNIGAAQSVETIIHAAEILQNEKINFHVVGDGSELENCKKLAKEKNLQNVIFHGRKPIEVMPEIYENSDAMLVTLTDDPAISKTLPGKVQSYMAAGKPILGAINGETAQTIISAECGFVAPAEDGEKFAECIKEFLKSDKEKLGDNSYKYYTQYFSKEIFTETLLRELQSQIQD